MATVKGSVGLDAAIIAGNSSEMDGAAGRVKGMLVTEALKHKLTGAFSRSFHVKTVRGRVGNGLKVNDRIVYSDDPAALAINYGHIAGKRPHSQSQHVPGKFIFEKVAGRA